MSCSWTSWSRWCGYARGAVVVAMIAAALGSGTGTASGAELAESQSAYSAQALFPLELTRTGEASADWDPLEPLNRVVFALNGLLDRGAIEPLARGWRALLPRSVRSGVTRVSANLQFPVRFVGCLAEGRPVASGQEVARFLTNSTIGFAGVFDPATRIGLRVHDEDLGRSFGRWGVGPGPYLVLPLLGPNSFRDLLDLPLRSAANAAPGLSAVNLINRRAARIAQVDAARAASLDLYVFARATYLRTRRVPEPGSLALRTAGADGRNAR
jgi:phospholipid-binding lipoprotein MlaA